MFFTRKCNHSRKVKWTRKNGNQLTDSDKNRFSKNEPEQNTNEKYGRLYYFIGERGERVSKVQKILSKKVAWRGVRYAVDIRPELLGRSGVILQDSKCRIKVRNWDSGTESYDVKWLKGRCE